MIFFLVSASVPIDIRAPSWLSLRGAPGLSTWGSLDPRPLHGNPTRLSAPRDRTQNDVRRGPWVQAAVAVLRDPGRAKGGRRPAPALRRTWVVPGSDRRRHVVARLLLSGGLAAVGVRGRGDRPRAAPAVQGDRGQDDDEDTGQDQDPADRRQVNATDRVLHGVDEDQAHCQEEDTESISHGVVPFGRSASVGGRRGQRSPSAAFHASSRPSFGVGALPACRPWRGWGTLGACAPPCGSPSLPSLLVTPGPG